MAKYKKTLEYQTKKKLQKTGTIAKKSLGQNFLIDESFLPLIISAAEISSRDYIVEIGPGLGVLTGELIKYAYRVIAVEIDGKLARQLEQKYSNADNLRIINQDILQVDINQFLENNSEYKVVANLPYNITSPVLNYFIDCINRPSRMVVMLQKEVADAIAADAGNMNFLSVKIRIFANPKIITYVPAKSFYPAPKVDSAVLSLDFYKQPLVQVKDMNRFLKFVKRSFHSPRKTILNSLVLGFKLGSEYAGEVISRAGIERQKRPGNLTLDEWSNLYTVIENNTEID